MPRHCVTPCGVLQEYLHMLPLVCNDSTALLFMFDLSVRAALRNSAAARRIHTRGG